MNLIMQKSNKGLDSLSERSSLGKSDSAYFNSHQLPVALPLGTGPYEASPVHAEISAIVVIVEGSFRWAYC